jgi:hypothetical protein
VLVLTDKDFGRLVAGVKGDMYVGAKAAGVRTPRAGEYVEGDDIGMHLFIYISIYFISSGVYIHTSNLFNLNFQYPFYLLSIHFQNQEEEKKRKKKKKLLVQFNYMPTLFLFLYKSLDGLLLVKTI